MKRRKELFFLTFEEAKAAAKKNRSYLVRSPDRSGWFVGVRIWSEPISKSDSRTKEDDSLEYADQPPIPGTWEYFKQDVGPDPSVNVWGVPGEEYTEDWSDCFDDMEPG
ncbi:MAG: hypothetical protein WC959_10980 [Kiritimatiellales bacterium]